MKKNFIQKIKSALRGVLKSIPFGNVIHEVKENLTIDKCEIKPEGVKQPHSWISIAIQLLILSAIVYSFITKQITIEQLINLLNT